MDFLRDTLRSIAANRELRGFLPTQVTLRVQGDITLAQLETALKAGGLEVYKDATDALCLRTVEAGNEHRALVRREREARLAHAQRHAALVREEGERNKANGYMAPLVERLDEWDADWRDHYGTIESAEANMLRDVAR